MNTVSSVCYISLILIVTFLLPTFNAMDTVNVSQIFRDNGTTLVSSSGTFELGFYSPEASKSRYVGIWYKNITPRTVVWVANRNDPLTDTSGMIKVTVSGSLILVNGTNVTIWSTNASRNVPNPVAQLLDSGNLVVRDADDENSENYLWQSFDYPTDTFLPDMKLGIDFVTGLEVYLTSPRGRNDPAVGDYTCHCDPTGYPQIVIKEGAAARSRTGPWNGLGFNGDPLLRNNDIFTFGLVQSRNEVYYHYELINSSVVTRFALSESGVGQMWVWDDESENWSTILVLPSDSCDNYNTCGPYGICNVNNSPPCGCLDKFKPKDERSWDRGDWSDGCVPRSEMNCGSGDGFYRHTGKLPDTRESWFDKSTSLEDCEALCLKNCSCTAYGSLYIDGNGCLLWFGELVDMRELIPGQDIFIRMASSELESHGGKRKVIIVTLSLVIGIVLLGLSLFLYARQRKKVDQTDSHSNENHADLELPLLEFCKITKATDNFSISNKLGQGGFGPVYKGVLEDGQEIAVKCLDQSSSQGVHEFKNEVICIGKLQHRNLVKLLGWCIRGEEMMLVYEYMANKSLDLLLFDPTKSILLDWPRRFNIIKGIARGLMYLHQDSRLRVIHRDLKASNILLDSDMNPKISDFGLARTFGGNETEANTTRVVGTYGYMSPEYAVRGVFSVKSDVFSFGVIVLEIVADKRNRGFSHRDHLLNLLGHAWVLYKEERSVELVDSCFRNLSCLPQVLRCIHIGLLCVQERSEDRPSMSSVVLMLSNDSALPEPNHPGFFTPRETLNTQNSVNSTTISLLEPR